MTDLKTDTLGTTLLRTLSEKRENLIALAGKYGVSNLRIFGSVARGEATAESDVDFLVTLAPESSLMDLAGFSVELEDELQCKVDVVADDNILPVLRDFILRDAVPI